MKVVFLDVGGVVLKIDWKVPFKNLGVDDPKEQNRLVEIFKASNLFHHFERGEIPSAEFFDGLNGLMGTKHPHDKLRAAWISLIIGELPGASELLKWIKSKTKLYALSNTNEVHDRYQHQAYPILKLFDQYFTSHTLGERKPDASIYTAVQKLTGAEAKDCLFIDDTAENVDAALKAGWQAVRTVDDTAASRHWLATHLGP
jgi:HAD superfamily hydrolase (TIGR01509 family)